MLSINFHKFFENFVLLENKLAWWKHWHYQSTHRFIDFNLISKNVEFDSALKITQLYRADDYMD